MEKTIVIDGREVRFKSTAAFLLRYKAQFQRDAFKDLLRLEKAINTETGELENYDALDLELFYNLTWVMAKTADPSIAEPLVWLDSFSEFPLAEILREIVDLLATSLMGTKKK
ncbi:MAG: hypothetical protein Q8N36_06275 [bacterium]|nr:hypothetical protein [bacterium]